MTNDVKMVYGVPPRPEQERPMLITDIKSAQEVNKEFEPGWIATPEGYLNERFGARLHVAVCDEDFNPKFDKIVMVSHGAAACPWGIDDDGNVRIALQWSFREVIRRVDKPYENGEGVVASNYGAWSLEMPRGFNNSVLSDTKDTATRELAEETGYGDPKRVQFLGTLSPDTAFDAIPIPIYAVQTEIIPLDTSLLDLDSGEKFGGVVGWVTLDEFDNLLLDQKIFCGFTLASYSFFVAKLKNGSLVGSPDAWIKENFVDYDSQTTVL